MIHDRTGEFIQNYIALGIEPVKIAVKAPNMNAIAERWIRSVREECLDNCIFSPNLPVNGAESLPIGVLDRVHHVV